jgi:hypothetical protein
MDNGKLIGKLNSPSATSISGVWSLSEHYTYLRESNWSVNDLTVRSGLTLDLDARTYVSGSTWTDSAQAIPFSSLGTQTPYTTFNGAKAFQFNASGYWQSTGTDHTKVDMGGDTTLIMWLWGASQPYRTTVFEKAGTVYQSYEQEIACTWETANNISYYSRYSPGYDYSDLNTTQTSGWFMWAIKMSTGKTSAARTGFRSLNGSAWTSRYFSNSNVALVPAGVLRVGSGYAGTVAAGGIGRVVVYNRMLSDADISSIYNSTKVNYGL